MKNHTKRFTGRAEDYAKYRPGYPEQIIHLLENKISFDSSKDVADVGCGTGLFFKEIRPPTPRGVQPASPILPASPLLGGWTPPGGGGPK